MKSREYRYLGFQNINQIQFQGVRALLKQAQTRCPQDLPHLSHLFHFRLFRVLQSKQQLLVEKIPCTLSREYHGEIEYLHILCWVCYSIISLITTIFSLYTNIQTENYVIIFLYFIAGVSCSIVGLIIIIVTLGLAFRRYSKYRSSQTRLWEQQ